VPQCYVIRTLPVFCTKWKYFCWEQRADDHEYGGMVEWYWQGNTEALEEHPVAAQLCPKLISFDCTTVVPAGSNNDVLLICAYILNIDSLLCCALYQWSCFCWEKCRAAEWLAGARFPVVAGIFFPRDHVEDHSWGLFSFPFRGYYALFLLNYSGGCVKCSIELKNMFGIYLAVSHIHGSVLMNGDDFIFIITGRWKYSISVLGSFR